MGSPITTGEALIRLRLDTKEAEADYRKFIAGMKGGAVSVPGFAPGGGGGTVPGGGGTWAPGGGGGGGFAPGGGGAGGGFLSSIMGFAMSNPLSAAAMAVGGAFVAPGIADAAGGVFNRVGQAGTDVSEALGLGSWKRRGEAPGRAADMTVEMLKYSGASMSPEQRLAVNAMNRQMVDLQIESENAVRKTIGNDRVSSFFEDMLAHLSNIDTSTKKTADTINPLPSPHSGGH